MPYIISLTLSRDNVSYKRYNNISYKMHRVYSLLHFTKKRLWLFFLRLYEKYLKKNRKTTPFFTIIILKDRYNVLGYIS